MGITFKIFKLFDRSSQKTYFSSVIECVYVAIAEHGLMYLKSFAAHLEISHGTVVCRGTQFEKHWSRL